MATLKTKVLKKIENIPFIGVFVLYTLRKLKLYLYYKPNFLLNRFRGGEGNIFKLHWIDPCSIRYISGGENFL